MSLLRRIIQADDFNKRVLQSVQHTIKSYLGNITQEVLRIIFEKTVSEILPKEPRQFSQSEIETCWEYVQKNIVITQQTPQSFLRPTNTLNADTSSQSQKTVSSQTLFLPENLKYHIFLSYKRENTATMNLVKNELTKRGFSVWTDELIRKGTPQWQIAIEEAIKASATLVCLLSPAAAKSVYVRGEIDIANLLKKPLFFTLVQGERQDCIIYPYTSHQMTDLRFEENFNRELNELADAIMKAIS